jgi:hypothetical protein
LFVNWGETASESSLGNGLIHQFPPVRRNVATDRSVLCRRRASCVQRKKRSGISARELPSRHIG